MKPGPQGGRSRMPPNSPLGGEERPGAVCASLWATGPLEGRALPGCQSPPRQSYISHQHPRPSIAPVVFNWGELYGQGGVPSRSRVRIESFFGGQRSNPFSPSPRMQEMGAVRRGGLGANCVGPLLFRSAVFRDRAGGSLPEPASGVFRFRPPHPTVFGRCLCSGNFLLGIAGAPGRPLAGGARCGFVVLERTLLPIGPGAGVPLGFCFAMWLAGAVGSSRGEGALLDGPAAAGWGRFSAADSRDRFG